MLIKKVLSTISSHSMVNKGDRVLVAISGGVDSVVLLDVLCKLVPQYQLELVLAHLDHKIRGEASRGDALFVARLASKRGLKLVSKAIDVSAVARKEKLGLEEAARMVRLNFLREVASDANVAKIAIGHTANDLAETILFNLIRGAGMTGIAGIKPVSLPFIRPLIDVTRPEIVSYANKNDLPWRYDHSNADTRFTRNRIRHEIIPIMETLNPRFVQAVSRMAEIVRDQDQSLCDVLDPLWESAIRAESNHSISLNRDYLKKCPSGITRALIRKALTKVRGNLQGISKTNIDDLCVLVKSSRAHGEVHLPHIQARIQENDVTLARPGLRNVRIKQVEVPLGITALPSFGITLNLKIAPWNGDLRTLKEQNENMEIIDEDKVSFPLHLRTRKPGDRFWPLGFSQTKKLKDFFIDAHVPFYIRDRVPLLCDREGIILVLGERISDTVRVNSKTKRVIVISWKEIS